jgi:hypothetical protein
MHRYIRSIERTRFALPLAALAGALGPVVIALMVDVVYRRADRVEVERVARAAALAGAGVYSDTGDEAAAVAAAIRHGSSETIRGKPVVILPEDVEVNAESQTVRVRIRTRKPTPEAGVTPRLPASHAPGGNRPAGPTGWAPLLGQRRV